MVRAQFTAKVVPLIFCFCSSRYSPLFFCSLNAVVQVQQCDHAMQMQGNQASTSFKMEVLDSHLYFVFEVVLRGGDARSLQALNQQKRPNNVRLQSFQRLRRASSLLCSERKGSTVSPSLFQGKSRGRSILQHSPEMNLKRRLNLFLKFVATRLHIQT